MKIVLDVCRRSHDQITPVELTTFATTKDRYKQSLVNSLAKKRKIHGISVLFFVSHHFTFNNIGRKKSLQSNNFSFTYYFWGKCPSLSCKLLSRSSCLRLSTLLFFSLTLANSLVRFSLNLEVVSIISSALISALSFSSSQHKRVCF